MTDSPRVNRYRQLILRLGDAQARALIDNLQVLALTSPDTVRELEVFMGRNQEPDQSGRPAGATSPKRTAEERPVQR
jgi:hypothetical protein